MGYQVQPPDFFQHAHRRERGPSDNTLRFLYYPPLAGTDARPDDVRAGAHSDYGSLTLLFRLHGQAGLEVLAPGDGRWAPVPVSPPGTQDDPAPPILMNIGDLLWYWTNGLLRSTVHRVVFRGGGGDGGDTLVEGETDVEPRYSIAFFCHPVGSSSLTPVPSKRVMAAASTSAAEGNSHNADTKTLTADEHLRMRLRATYLRLYDEEK